MLFGKKIKKENVIRKTYSSKEDNVEISFTFRIDVKKELEAGIKLISSIMEEMKEDLKKIK
jgi:hypothetical protein